MEYVIARRWRRRRRNYRERVIHHRASYLTLTEQECRWATWITPPTPCSIQLPFNNLLFSLTQEQITPVPWGGPAITCIVASDADPGGPCALPVAVRVTAALTFFATGSFQHTVASVVGISQAAVSLAIHAVSTSLVRHANEHIIFPSSPASQLETKRGFLLKYGFPGVLGAIDCTHVQLRAPETQALIYVNRKGVHSINI